MEDYQEGWEKINLLLNIKVFFFLDYTLKVLEEIGFNEVYVSCSYKSYTLYTNYKSSFDCNIFLGVGPIAGIFSILLSKYFRNYKYFLVFSVDMPLITKELLLNLLMNKKDGFSVIYKGCIFPLLLNINDNILYIIFNLYRHKNYRLYSLNVLLSLINIVELNYIDIYGVNLLNINTQEDLWFLSFEI